MPNAVLGLVVTLILQAGGAKSLQPSAPQVIGTVDAGKLKGEPTELAWSPDASKFFLQTSERDSRAMIKNPRFFVLGAADGKPESVGAMPDWASEYWQWKSNKNAPGSTTLSIDVKQEQRQGVATAAPMGGSLAKGGGAEPGAGSTVEDVTMRAQQMQQQQVFTLTLKNEIVGEFVNQQFLPGYTFGWAPQGGLIAYRNQSGRLAIMDEHGDKREVADTKDVLLPAWSGDGSKIAFLQRAGKNKYDLVVVNVKP
jgi:hypothetical protein